MSFLSSGAGYTVIYIITTYLAKTSIKFEKFFTIDMVLSNYFLLLLSFLMLSFVHKKRFNIRPRSVFFLFYFLFYLKPNRSSLLSNRKGWRQESQHWRYRKATPPNKHSSLFSRPMLSLVSSSPATPLWLAPILNILFKKKSWCSQVRQLR